MLNNNTGIYCKSASNVESRKSSRFPPIKYETGLGIRGPFVDSSSASNSSCLSFRPRTYTKLKFSLKAGMTSSHPHLGALRLYVLKHHKAEVPASAVVEGVAIPGNTPCAMCSSCWALWEEPCGVPQGLVLVPSQIQWFQSL